MRIDRITCRRYGAFTLTETYTETDTDKWVQNPMRISVGIGLCTEQEYLCIIISLYPLKSLGFGIGIDQSEHTISLDIRRCKDVFV